MSIIDENCTSKPSAPALTHEHNGKAGAGKQPTGRSNRGKKHAESTRPLDEFERDPDFWRPAGRTDEANGRRLVLRHGEQVRWCDPWRKWLVWDGRRWLPDAACRVESFAKDVGRYLFRQVADSVAHVEDKQLQELTRFAKASCNVKGWQNMMIAARSEPGIAIDPMALDGHDMLLNCLNGTIDLTTGELRPHERGDLLTKLAPVEFRPDAECPRWEAFLLGIMAGNLVLVRFLQRLFGYCLSGSGREQVLPILWGGGSNGKSTLLGTLLALLGEYAGKAAPDLLMARGGKSHPTELADLHGRRLVFANETEDGRRFAESLVKDLTGNDRIKARRMREDFWEFDPTHKIILATNHRPEVRGNDHAIWRRLLLVPFNVKYWDPDKDETGPAELQVDKGLPEKLKAESSGIVRWLVEGCLAWQRNGLQVPREVRAATDEYRHEEDLIGRFIQQCCTVDSHARVGKTELFEAYRNFSGDTELKQASFGKLLGARGLFHSDRFTAGPQKGREGWFGIGLSSTRDDFE